MSVRRPRSAIQRLYAVGDVHGRLDLFQQLMAMVEHDQAQRSPVPTRIVLLGDIIDRGPDSASMVRGCMKLTAHSTRFVVLKGNHEEMMVAALTGDLEAYEAWLRFGGKDTLSSWGMDRAALEQPATMETLRMAADLVGRDVIAWLSKLPLHHRHGDFLLVHAGIRPGVPLRRQQPGDLLWIKEAFLDSDADHDWTVVHGHSIDETGPVVRANRIGIDTGAYRTGRLTALGIEGREHWTLSTVPDARAERETISCGVEGI